MQLRRDVTEVMAGYPGFEGVWTVLMSRTWRFAVALTVATSGVIAATGSLSTATAASRFRGVSFKESALNPVAAHGRRHQARSVGGGSQKASEGSASEDGSLLPIVLVPNTVSPFRDTFSLAVRDSKASCLVRLQSVIVEPNLWNAIPSVADGACAQTEATADAPGHAEGGVSWSYGDEALTMHLRLASTWRGNGDSGPVGYPEIYYGYSPYAGVASSPMPSDFELPSKVADLPNVVLRTSYTSSGYATSDSNVAYDMFLSENDLDSSATSSHISWCGTGIQNPPAKGSGAVSTCTTAPSDVLEVMIWLAHSAIDSRYQPATRTGSAIGVFSPVIGRGGSAMRSHFEMWSCIFGSPDCNGRGDHSVVSFVLSAISGSDLPNGLVDGTISIPLKVFLLEAIKLATDTGARNLSDNSYLNAIELGDEVSPTPQDNTGPVSFELRLSSYCYLFELVSLGSPFEGCPAGKT
jgi:hypothetical protein